MASDLLFSLDNLSAQIGDYWRLYSSHRLASQVGKYCQWLEIGLKMKFWQLGRDSDGRIDLTNVWMLILSYCPCVPYEVSWTNLNKQSVICKLNWELYFRFVNFRQSPFEVNKCTHHSCTFLMCIRLSLLCYRQLSMYLCAKLMTIYKYVLVSPISVDFHTSSRLTSGRVAICRGNGIILSHNSTSMSFRHCHKPTGKQH